jgi:hypothetical protein
MRAPSKLCTPVVNALRPAMATVPGSLLVAIRPARHPVGHLPATLRPGGDPVLVWQAPTQIMNAAVDETLIDAAYADDPAVAAVEYGAESRSDIDAFPGVRAPKAPNRMLAANALARPARVPRVHQSVALIRSRSSKGGAPPSRTTTRYSRFTTGRRAQSALTKQGRQ